jgi:hypothetical protein
VNVGRYYSEKMSHRQKCSQIAQYGHTDDVLLFVFFAEDLQKQKWENFLFSDFCPLQKMPFKHLCSFFERWGQKGKTQIGGILGFTSQDHRNLDQEHACWKNWRIFSAGLHPLLWSEVLLSPVKMFQCLPCLGWRSADFFKVFFAQNVCKSSSNIHIPVLRFLWSGRLKALKLNVTDILCTRQWETARHWFLYLRLCMMPGDHDVVLGSVVEQMFL